MVAIKNGKSDDAIQLMNKVVAIDPTSPEAISAKATLETLNK